MEIILKDWRLKESEETGLTIAGTYAVVLNGKDIARQEFNTGYGGARADAARARLKSLQYN